MADVLENDLRELEAAAREFKQASQDQEVCQATQDIRGASIIGAVISYLDRNKLRKFKKVLLSL